MRIDPATNSTATAIPAAGDIFGRFDTEDSATETEPQRILLDILGASEPLWHVLCVSQAVSTFTTACPERADYIVYIAFPQGAQDGQTHSSVRRCHPLARCSCIRSEPRSESAGSREEPEVQVYRVFGRVLKSGVPQGEVKQAQLSLDIDEIETEDGTARVTGTSGAVHVTALLTVSSLHFMERSVTGTLNVTTVFAPGGSSQTLRAVHARHDYLPMSIPGFVSEPTVTQNYGTCEAAATALPGPRAGYRNKKIVEIAVTTRIKPSKKRWDSVDQPQPCKKHRRRRRGSS